MLTSRLSSKGQVTLPKQVRKTLGAQPGDVIVYEVEEGTVQIRRLDPLDAAFYAAVSSTLEEWATPEDEEAFRDL
jgi:AbrB family looped-hinge helix DNA binding protein